MNQARQFTEAERKVLSLVQADLPDSLTPFADLAKEAGVSEDFVLDLLTRLKEDGSIRRFGASVKHQKAGISHNAMVAWIASEEEANAAGPEAAKHPNISHCYYRPSSAPDWPYTLFTMIHGRSEAECQAVIDHCLANTCLRTYAILTSLKELKKISMTYF